MTDEIERLRAELAAEREKGWKAHAANLSLEEDNDALRELLREAREDPDYRSLKGGLRARIDAALKGDGDDGNA